MENSKDYIQQLAEYIIKNLAKGYTLESLKVALSYQGYSKISIDNAIKKANSMLADKAPPMKEKPQITYRLIEEPADTQMPIDEVKEDDDGYVVYETTYTPEEEGFWSKLKTKLFG
ncbi:hypothetical protein GOV14_00560 [Candidatus Pacearchaeota archaeon]|nr:hypothetical protein [Candidatus Pacearchaeota archaeon]